MDKLRHYILYNLSILFFSIFLPLFAIASVIFIIKLATYTAVIKLTLGEMAQLYLFVLPDLFFFTLPIAFIVSAALSLYRLSNDSELLVAFSLGISPLYLLRILIKPAALLTLILLIDFLLIAPYVNIISGNFVKNKKDEAQFNITASEFGHTFGDWMLFINKSDGHRFEEIVLFNNAIKDSILIHAGSAELENHDGLLQLKLSNGNSFAYNNELLKQISFEKAYINDVMQTRVEEYKNIIDYWTNDVHSQRKKQQLITYTLLSLFPILSLFFVLSVGIVHARHQKRWIYLWLFLAIVVYYTLSSVLHPLIGFHTIWSVAAGWLMVTYLIYHRSIRSRF